MCFILRGIFTYLPQQTTKYFGWGKLWSQKVAHAMLANGRDDRVSVLLFCYRLQVNHAMRKSQLKILDQKQENCFSLCAFLEINAVKYN